MLIIFAVTKEFNNILDSCNQITKNPPTSKEWWKIRKELDAQLRDLLYNIENWWLGGFKVNFLISFIFILKLVKCI